ncbi:hypothetical protein IV203_009377 [Nitzschia inconspicua]|uniref:Uncharacterized protein n=1 Tax=Nitzschia inconspicua TaxID=303405 RepID=A0A9K3L1V9_9STRA|nr:hypothetical protein IV203_009377 [Nitzschia inconspicua]
MIFDKNLGLSSYVDYFESAKNVALNATSWTGLSFGESWQADENESISIRNTAVSPNPELQLSTTDPLVWTDNLYRSIRDNKIILSASTPIKVDEEVGFIIPSGGSSLHRLVVNVNETYLFWNNGQDRLCQLLRSMTLSPSLDGTQDVPTSLLNITMDCYDHAINHQGFGQGNWITAVYAARMATALAGVNFKFQCSDGQRSRMQLLLPWLDAYQPAPSNRKDWPYSGTRPTQATACNSKYSALRIDKMASEIQSDIRKMAVALVGDQTIVHRYPQFASHVPPLIPNIDLDNVAIHFRCGDVLGGAKRNDFGMIRFYEYKKWIPRSTTSIGILTQPFEKERNRGKDAGKADSCRVVVGALVDYLQAFAPNANISIHNGANETLPLAYARLAMANFSFTSLSSFGIFPVVGTFGEGHFQKGNGGVNPFATYIPQYLPNIHQMNAEVRGTWEMWGKSLEDLVAWFVDESTAPKEIFEVPEPPGSETTYLNHASSEVPTLVAWSEEVNQMVKKAGASFDATMKIAVEDAFGVIRNGTLIVDVDESYLFWDGGSIKLCQLLKNLTLTDSLEGKQPVPLALVNATMDCVDHAKNKEGFGQGNWVTAVYASRMAAALAGVDFKFQCTDGQQSRMELLLPWFDQYQTANPKNRSVWPYTGSRPNEKEACPPKYPFLRIDKMADQIQQDIRRMAVRLIGTRDDSRRHPDVAVDDDPLIPGIELDDAVIHFRCGDVMGGANRYDFGMIRFNEYKKWIPSTTKSIGILTQPFEKERNRRNDSGKADACRQVVYALVDYLQTFAPGAKISIYNNVNETLPLAYARLAMANYSITSLSSFGIFPVIGSFGQGYFQAGNRGVNPFARYLPEFFGNLHMMNADVRPTGQMRNLPVEDLIAWFTNDTASSG